MQKVALVSCIFGNLELEGRLYGGVSEASGKFKGESYLDQGDKEGSHQVKRRGWDRGPQARRGGRGGQGPGLRSTPLLLCVLVDRDKAQSRFSSKVS